MKIVHPILHYGYGALLRVKGLIRLPFDRSLYKGECYYPEYLNKRKGTLAILADQAANIMRFGYPNKFYFMYGLDIRGEFDKNDYVDYSAMKQRSALNTRAGQMSTVPVLRNKDIFGTVANEYGFPTPHNIGIICDNKIYLYESKHEVDLMNYFMNNDVDAFLKKIDGECADGVYSIKTKNGKILIDGHTFNTLHEICGGGVFLLQDRLKSQHADISAIYPHSINTIRLVTVTNLHTKEVEVLGAVLRVGASGNHVDNWAVGGLAIGIDLSANKLRKYGYYKPGYGIKTDRHPDTGIIFSGYTIPFMSEAINTAIQFHKRLRNIHSIGWDIAITENGPCFIEGNDNWEISNLQVSSQGLSQQFKRLFY